MNSKDPPTPHDLTEKLTGEHGSNVQSRLKNDARKVSLDSDTDSCCQMVLSWRFAMALMLCLTAVMACMPTITMPLALVCMNRPLTSSSPHENSTTWNMTTVVYKELLTNSTSQTQDQGASEEFSWDSETQGLILSSYLFTAFIGPTLSNAMRHKLGNKWTMVVFLSVSALLTLVTPVSARISPYALMVVRMLQGFTIFSAMPIIGDTLAWWSPHTEKLTLAAIAYLGMTLTGLFLFIFGYLCSVPIDNGWPFVFYVYGTMISLFTISWIVLTSPKPETHPFISDREKLYILTHRRGMDSGGKGQREKTPYKKIFTSIPVLAYLVCCTCYVCSIIGLSVSLPTYYNKVLNISVETTGIFLTLNTVGTLFGAFCWPALSNGFISRCRMTINKSRKTCIFSGMTGASVTFLGLAFLDASITSWVIVTVTIATYFCLSVGTGIVATLPLDMAPRYAGFISSLDFTFCTVLSFPVPLIISQMTPTNSIQEWQIVWILFAVLTLSGALLFLLMGNASMQSWATPTIEESKEHISLNNKAQSTSNHDSRDQA